jgi:phosphate transport system substrate-binding protein
MSVRMPGQGRWRVGLVGLFLGLTSCTSTAPVDQNRVQLNGAGSTFVAPLFHNWIKEYEKSHPEVAIDYQVVGSGEGVARFLGKSELDKNPIDFGASDDGVTEEESQSVSRKTLMIPATIGMVAVAYNVPGVDTGLKLSREALAGIFLGTITRWNDPALGKTNEGVTLPDRPISVIVRQDSSGTTYTFTNYLAAISSTFHKKVGRGRTVNWPLRVMQGPGNNGQAALLTRTEGSIGYVDQADTRKLNLAVALLENKAGRFVGPLPVHGEAAIAGINFASRPLAFIPPGGLIADPSAPDAYPITTFSWILLYRHYEDANRLRELRRFLNWCLTAGQEQAPKLGYLRLPNKVAEAARQALETLAP